MHALLRMSTSQLLALNHTLLHACSSLTRKVHQNLAAGCHPSSKYAFVPDSLPYAHLEHLTSVAGMNTVPNDI